MKRGSLLAAVLASALAMVVADADAARMGGGRSVGRQSGNVMQRAPAQPAPQAPSAAPGPQGVQPAQAARQPAAAQPGAAAAAQPSRSRWLAPLAGLAAGLGLAALASHFGFGEGLASFMTFLLIVMAAFMLYRIWRARRAGAAGGMTSAPMGRSGLGYAGVGNEAATTSWTPPASTPRPVEVVRPVPASSVAVSPASSDASWHVPAGMDVDAFLRTAKQQFVQLQSAYDAGRLDDLRDYTTPDMYAELAREVRARGSAPNRTDVVTIDAELLGIESRTDEHLASVRFHGTLRETEDGGATSFDEVWNLSKPADGSSGWVLAGIQQLA